jgi:hypothetical protein
VEEALEPDFEIGLPELKKVSVAGKEYEVRFNDYGVEMRLVGEEWPFQYLGFHDLAPLIALKEKFYLETKRNTSEGEKLWRAEVARQLTGGTE